MTNQSAKIGAVILAAGESSRFGDIKQLARFEGETFIGRAYRAAIEADCAPVVVVLGANSELIAAQLIDTRIKLSLNKRWREGMASSVVAGITTLLKSDKIGGALLMLADQPLITAKELGDLKSAFAGSNCTIAASQYQKDEELVSGVPAIFSVELFPELLGLDGRGGAKAVIINHQSNAVFVPMPRAAVDIDTRSDLLTHLGCSDYQPQPLT